MGLFDTIIFDRPLPCPKCGAEIRSDQTKAFECALDDYRRRQEAGVRGRALLRSVYCTTPPTLLSRRRMSHARHTSLRRVSVVWRLMIAIRRYSCFASR